jgi:hypothetical protein
MLCYVKRLSSQNYPGKPWLSPCAGAMLVDDKKNIWQVDVINFIDFVRWYGEIILSLNSYGVPEIVIYDARNE